MICVSRVTVTDGEFCTLRTKGETIPLHVWQLIDDAWEKARNMTKKILEGCILAKSGKIIILQKSINKLNNKLRSYLA